MTVIFFTRPSTFGLSIVTVQLNISMPRLSRKLSPGWSRKVSLLSARVIPPAGMACGVDPVPEPTPPVGTGGGIRIAGQLQTM
jgi:hypothetical protein